MAKWDGHEIETGIDGNCGFALIGPDLQQGDAEFVEIEAPGDDAAKLTARFRAMQNLCKRIDRDYDKECLKLSRDQPQWCSNERTRPCKGRGIMSSEKPKLPNPDDPAYCLHWVEVVMLSYRELEAAHDGKPFDNTLDGLDAAVLRTLSRVVPIGAAVDSTLNEHKDIQIKKFEDKEPGYRAWVPSTRGCEAHPTIARAIEAAVNDEYYKKTSNLWQSQES